MLTNQGDLFRTFSPESTDHNAPPLEDVDTTTDRTMYTTFRVDVDVYLLSLLVSESRRDV